MRESVKYDLKGDLRVDFDEHSLTHVRHGFAWLRLSGMERGRTVVANTPVAYRDIEWVGVVWKKQWWLVLPIIPFSVLSALWLAGPYTRTNFIGAWIVLALLVAAPLFLLWRGRPWLGIASATQIILLPMDRHKRKIKRVLGLLAIARVMDHAECELAGTRFAAATWDTRPMSGKSFTPFAPAVVSAALGVLAAFNLSRREGVTPKILAIVLGFLFGVLLYSFLRRFLNTQPETDCVPLSDAEGLPKRAGRDSELDK